MSAPTDHYLSSNVHKRKVQVAVLDEEGGATKEVRVANTDPDEITQEYT